MKNNKAKQFVITLNNDVANRLKIDGYTFLSESNGQYMFLNNGTLKFNEGEDISEVVNKMHYTNVLCMVE